MKQSYRSLLKGYINNEVLVVNFIGLIYSSFIFNNSSTILGICEEQSVHTIYMVPFSSPTILKFVAYINLCKREIFLSSWNWRKSRISSISWTPKGCHCARLSPSTYQISEITQDWVSRCILWGYIIDISAISLDIFVKERAMVERPHNFVSAWFVGIRKSGRLFWYSIYLESISLVTSLSCG